MYNYRVLLPAENDLESIAEYIATELGNPKAAVNFLDEVQNKIEKLVRKPGMYELCSNKILAQKGYRKVLVGNYLLFYTVDEPGQTVYIMRVIYARRNYAELI